MPNELEMRRLLADQYAEGYMAGFNECFQVCMKAMEEVVGPSGLPLPELFAKQKTPAAAN